MKQSIRDLIMGLQFLYPCFAYEDGESLTEINIVAETYVSKLYPLKLSVKGMKSLGEDYWGRSTFIDENENYYCELDDALYFKGTDFDGEPDFKVNNQIIYEFPIIDSELKEFTPYLEKVKKYAQEKNMELISHNLTVSENKSEMVNSIIICRYKFKIKN